VAPKAFKSTSSPSLAKLNISKLTDPINNKKSYTQASYTSVEDIIHIKDVFPTALPKKIIEINNIINKSGSVKLKVNMTIKELSRKQVFIFMSKDNAKVIGSNASSYIMFINSSLQEANSNTLANFIHLEKLGIIITTNQVTSTQDMSIIEDILKNSKNINQDLIKSSHLSQSKLFLKILGLLYYSENTNKAISPNIILRVLKESHIFK